MSTDGMGVGTPRDRGRPKGRGTKNDPFLINFRDHFWDPKSLRMSWDLIKKGSKKGSQKGSKKGSPRGSGPGV